MASLLGRIRTSLVYNRLTDPSPKQLRPGGFFRIAVGFLSIWCAGAVFDSHFYTYLYGTGASMLPTVPERGIIQLISKHYRNGRDLKIGDFICVRNPLFPREFAGKRVLGLPGDYVVRDYGNQCVIGGSVNGGMRGEGREVDLQEERTEPMMIRVPEGHVWLTGDNLGGSRDSRFFGPCPLGLVEGKVLWVGNGWFSWTYMGGDHKRPFKGMESV